MKCCICGCETVSTLDPWPVCYEDGAVCCQRCYTLTVFPELIRKQQYLKFLDLDDFVDADCEVIEDGNS